MPWKLEWTSALAAMWNELLGTEFCLDNKQPKEKKKKDNQITVGQKYVTHVCGIFQ